MTQPQPKQPDKSRFSDPYIGRVYCREGHLVWDRGDESRRPCPCNQKEESK